MKTFTIYPDSARALGNVMNNNSNVSDMISVNSLVEPLLDTEHPITDEEGNTIEPPITISYDNLSFPVFRIGVNTSLYDTILILNLSKSSCYVGEDVTISARVLDNEGNPINATVFFKKDADYIGPDYTGNSAVYASTNEGTYRFNYSFDSEGEYIILAESVETNRYHSAESSRTVTVSRKPMSINIEGIVSSTTYIDDIDFNVLLSSNGASVVGLHYSILLDGESFDNGTSTANGDDYTMSNLDSGYHTLEIYFAGNNMYESCTESITFYNGKIPEVTVDWKVTSFSSSNRTGNATLTIECYSETLPVTDMEVTVQTSIQGNNITLSAETDSSGKAILPLNGIPAGDYTLTITTPDYGGLTHTTVTKQVTMG